MLEVGRSRGRIGRIHPSVNPFVPKPGTPYQWLPMEDPKETDRKLQFLRKAFGAHAERGRDLQERAHRRRRSRSWPWPTAAWPTRSSSRCVERRGPEARR